MVLIRKQEVLTEGRRSSRRSYMLKSTITCSENSKEPANGTGAPQRQIALNFYCLDCSERPLAIRPRWPMSDQSIDHRFLLNSNANPV